MNLYHVAAAIVMLVWLGQVEARTEAEHRDEWCAAHGGVKTNGSFEYPLSDLTRVDCLTLTHAIEFDFGPKWAEAIGQSLHYARMTGNRPGVVIIVGAGEQRFLGRLFRTIVAHGLPIDVWVVPR